MTSETTTPESGPNAWTADRLIRITKIALVLKVVLLFALSWNTLLVMDEFWHFHQTFYVGNGLFDEVWPEKAVLYAAYFKIPALLGNGAVNELLLARVMGAGLATVLVLVVYQTCRSLRYTELQALLVALALLSFSTFMERSFRLRSEPLALLLAATAVLVVVRTSADRVSALIWAGILSGLAFVTTQKSVYFNVALGAGLVVDASVVRNFRGAVSRAALLLAGWIAALVAYALAFGGSDFFEVLRLTFLGPLEVATTAQTYYDDFSRFRFQTLTRNSFLYLACFLGLVIQTSRFLSLPSNARIHLVVTVIMAALVFSHNQPWPYVFTMVLPFLVPYILPAYRQIATFTVFAKVIVLLFILAVTLNVGTNINYLRHHNRAQLTVIETAEAALPKDGSYFDGIGMLPNHKMRPYSWLDAMWIAKTQKAGTSSALYQGLQDNPPDLIIETYRTKELGGLLEPLINGSYVSVSPNILAPGRWLVDGGTVDFQVLKEADFIGIEAATGAFLKELVVNGIPVSLPHTFEVGKYSISSSDDQAIWILPNDLTLTPPEAPVEDTVLFERVYSF